MAELQHVKGLAELQKYLDNFTPKMEANFMRGGLRAATVQEILPEVQANLLHNGSVRTGELIAGLKVGTRNERGAVKAVLKVTGKHAFVAKWIEFTGARAHSITAKGLRALSFGGRLFQTVNHPGFKAKPFLRPALDTAAAAAVVALGNYIKYRIESKEGIDTKHITVEGDE